MIGLKLSNPLDRILRGTSKVVCDGAAIVATGILKTAQGVDVASGASIALGDAGNLFKITGTTTITTITAKTAGTMVTLWFASTANLAPGGNLLNLPGRFIPQVNDTCHLISDGTNWIFLGPRPDRILIERKTLGATGDLDFQNIPGEFAALDFEGMARGSGAVAQNDLNVRFNNDTAANYSMQMVTGLNATVAAAPNVTNTGIRFARCTGNSGTASRFSPFKLYVPGYAGATHKGAYGASAHSDSDVVGGQGVAHGGGVWRNTAAITRAQIFPDTGQFLTGTVVSLYGVV